MIDNFSDFKLHSKKIAKYKQQIKGEMKLKLFNQTNFTQIWPTVILICRHDTDMQICLLPTYL